MRIYQVDIMRLRKFITACKQKILYVLSPCNPTKNLNLLFLQVQARLDTCCNCGVAIKEGYYFKIVELCSSIAAGDSIIIAKTRYTSDMAKNGFYTERASKDFNAGESIIVS
jgi:hypothetical protein